MRYSENEGAIEARSDRTDAQWAARPMLLSHSETVGSAEEQSTETHLKVS